MSKLSNSLSEIRLLDELAKRESPVHRLHPVAKILTTVIYLTVVISFGRDEVSGLLPFILYPVLIFAVTEMPVLPFFKRLLLVSPLLLGIGILNPVFARQTVSLAGFEFSQGWLTFLSIMLKGSLTVIAGLLLIATTGMDKLAAGLRALKIPKAFVLQLLLTYRYIYVLIEEVSMLQRAYYLRAPGQKGIYFSVWGSLAGQVLLRTIDRSQRLYHAMILRGFRGEYHMGKQAWFSLKDNVYILGWALFFVVCRLYDLPVLFGNWLLGGIR